MAKKQTEKKEIQESVIKENDKAKELADLLQSHLIGYCKLSQQNKEDILAFLKAL